MINPITNLEINKEINHIFDTIKSNIVLKASVNSYRLMNHILSVKLMNINHILDNYGMNLVLISRKLLIMAIILKILNKLIVLWIYLIIL